MYLVPNLAEFGIFGENRFVFADGSKQFVPILLRLAALMGKVGQPKDFCDDTKLFGVLHNQSKNPQKDTFTSPKSFNTCG